MELTLDERERHRADIERLRDIVREMVDRYYRDCQPTMGLTPSRLADLGDEAQQLLHGLLPRPSP